MRGLVAICLGLVIVLGAGAAIGDTESDESRSFIVDTVPPTVMFTSGPTGPTNDDTPTFEYITGGDPVTTDCTVDTGTYVPCPLPLGTFTTAPLSQGPHQRLSRIPRP